MENYVICRLCDKKLKSINNAHLNFHGYSAQQYKTEFNCEYLVSEYVHKKIIDASKIQASYKKGKKERK